MKSTLPHAEEQAAVYAQQFNTTIARVLKNVQNQRILDMGCNTANLGAWLKQRGNEVIGVDVAPNVVQIASTKIDRAIVLNIEEEAPPFAPASFDWILFADLLEHLRQPREVLNRCLPLLKEGGRVIISVPNIANYSIRWRLLLGRFNYTSDGILDRTHVHFFTQSSLLQLHRDLGLRILLKEITLNPFPPFHLPLLSSLYSKISRHWPELFAFQFVIVSQR